MLRVCQTFPHGACKKSIKSTARETRPETRLLCDSVVSICATRFMTCAITNANANANKRTQKKKANETKEKSVLSRTRKRSAKSDPLKQERGCRGVERGAVSNTIVMAAVIRDHVQYAPRSDSFRFLHDLRS